MKKNDEEGMEVRVQMCCCGEWQFAGHAISWSHSIETGLLLLSVAHGEPDIDGGDPEGWAVSGVGWAG